MMYSVIKILAWYVLLRCPPENLDVWCWFNWGRHAARRAGGSLFPTWIKLTYGINFIYNRSEWFQQILIIHLLIRAYLSGLCCRPWLDALFVSCIWDELGWFCLRHVPVQYISWNCGHTGQIYHLWWWVSVRSNHQLRDCSIPDSKLSPPVGYVLHSLFCVLNSFPPKQTNQIKKPNKQINTKKNKAWFH